MNAILDRMVENSVQIFYEGNGLIRSVAGMTDESLTVEENTYWRD
jgi:hypothetical protein